MEFLETKYLYFYLLLFSMTYPLLQSFEKRLSYYKKFKALIGAIVIMALLFIPWDIFFTLKKVWWFNSDYISDFKLFELPIEEVLFFVIVPFACVFIYEVVKYFFNTSFLKQIPLFVFSGLSVVLLIFALLNYSKTYTFINFLLTSIALFLVILKRPKWLNNFFVTYILTIIPFLLINGILTGALTKLPVVNYNPAEIIGVRIITIPIEDFVYNLLMLLMVIYFYEYFLRKNKN